MKFINLKTLLLLSIAIFLVYCAEEPKSEWDILREYCQPIQDEFAINYNIQSELEDAERLLYPDFRTYSNKVLPLSLMGSAEIIKTLLNDDCFTKFDYSELYEWKMDDYLAYGGSCAELARYVNKVYLDYCERDYNSNPPRLPISFADGTFIDYQKHFQEFKDEGDLGGYVLFLQLRDLDKKLEQELQNLENENSVTSSTTTTTKPTTTTTTSTTTTTKPTTTTTKPTTTTTTSTTTTVPKVRPELPTLQNLSITRNGSSVLWSVVIEFSEPYNNRYTGDRDFGSFYFKICKDPLGENSLDYGCKSEDEAWVKPESSLNKELLDDFTIRYSGYLYQRNVTNGYGSDTKWSTSFSQSSLIDNGGNSYWLVPVSLDIFLPHYGSDNCTASFKFMSGWGVPAKSIKYTSFRDRCPKIPNDKTISWDPFSSWNGDTFNGLPAVKIFP